MALTQGLLHLYSGDGKGKTSIAVGMTIRAAGAGWRVIFAQFLKSGETGELAVLQSLSAVSVLRVNGRYGFTWELDSTQRARLTDAHNALFDEAVRQCGTGERTLLVLDEAIGALSLGFLDRARVMDFLRHRPTALEVVLTGRDPDTELAALADYHSEVRAIRHPMDRGVSARHGIEW